MKKFFYLLVPLVFILASCGGGGSDSGDGGGKSPFLKAIAVEGLVSDPPISGARVVILKGADNKIYDQCGLSDNKILCQTFTDKDGKFSFIVPEDFDYSKYYLKTYGGKDEKTGVNFYDLSMESPLALYADSSSPVVSPVTTIMNAMHKADPSISADKIVSDTKEALGLDSEDPKADPISNPVLFKRSFVLMSAALAYRNELVSNAGNNEKPFDAVCRTVDGNASIIGNDGTLSHSFVDNVFKEFEGTASYDDLKANLEDSAYIVANTDTTSGNMVDEIKRAEVLSGLKKALLTASGNGSSTDETLNNNAEAFAQKIESIISDIPADKFVMMQIVKYCMSKEESFQTEEGLTADDFTTKLDSLVGMADFKANIGRVISVGNVNMVNLPLAKSRLVGNDNAKRIAYYFNSNVDFNYKAAQLISKVQDDDVHNSIYLSAAASYAKNGLADKANNIADAYIHGSMTRAEAKYEVGYGMLDNRKKEEAFKIFQEAVNIVKNIYESRGDGIITGDEADALTWLSNGYFAAGHLDDANELKDYIINKLGSIEDPKIKATTAGRLLFRQRNVIDELVEQKQPSEVIEKNIELLNKIREFSGQENANIEIMILVDIMKYYRFLEDKDKLIAAYHEMETFGNVENPTPNAKEDKAYNFFKQMIPSAAGYLYWADATEVMNLFGTEMFAHRWVYRWGKWKEYDNTDTAAKKVALEMASSGSAFADITTFLGTYFPYEADYSNIYDYMNLMTYLGVNEGNAGIALNAIKNGNNALAKAAIDFMVVKTDELAEYCDVEEEVADNIEDLVYFYNRYSEAGYTKLGYLYGRIGEKDLQEDMYVKAADIAEELEDSLSKAEAYATIGWFFHKAGYADEAKANFNKAKAVTIAVKESGKIEQKDMDDLSQAFRGVLEDNYIIQDKDVMKEILPTALEIAESIYANGDDDDNAAYSEVKELYKLAPWYIKAGDKNGFLSTMEKAIETAKLINSDNKKKKAYSEIIEVYGENNYMEEAVKKARELLELETDYNDAIADLAEGLASYDDFDDHDLDYGDIATVDTDNDGKPNFFLPWVTQAEIEASGLVLDDDCDGDGIPDTEDTMPLFPNN